MKINLFKDAPLFSFIKDLEVQTSRHFSALDGLRGIAVLLVVASHTNGLNLYGQGGLGVWIFFVLSGFLLTDQFLQDPTRLKALGIYWLRRIRRIIPMYYTVLSILFITGLWTFSNFLKHILFLKADDHFWTIPQELTFYIILPVIVLIGQKIMKEKKLLMGIILIILAIICGRYLTEDSVFHYVQNGLNLRFFLAPFLVGTAVAYINADQAVQKVASLKIVKVVSLIIGTIITLGLFFSASYYIRLIPSLSFINVPVAWNYSTICSLFAGVLLLILISYKDSLLNKLFSLSPLRLVGLVSFSLYLIHPFVISLLGRYGVTGNYLFPATLILSLLVSIFTYTTIERTFTKK